jgi:hypothetical protein
MKYFIRRPWVILITGFLLAGAATSALPSRTIVLAARTVAGPRDPILDISSTNEAAYWDLVRSTREDVKQLGGAPLDHIKQGLSQLADQWRSITEVEMDDGRVVPIDNGYLLAFLQADQPDLNKIAEILDTLLAAHAEYPNQVFSAADLDPLHEILSRPEFLRAERAPNPLSEWFQKLVNRFLHWLDGREIGIPAPPMLPLIASILLVLVLFLVFRTLFNDLVNEAHIKKEDGEENEPLTAEDAFEKAQSLSRGGDYRSAVRYLYLSSLLLLDERNILRYDRSKTNREYLRSVSNSPELAQPLSEVIEVFDDVWYGYHSLEEDSFKHYSKRVEELKEKKQ